MKITDVRCFPCFKGSRNYLFVKVETDEGLYGYQGGRWVQRWPDAAFLGGQIVPRFLGPEPPWLRPAWSTVANVYATRELGDEPFPFDRKQLPFGANMACRVAVQTISLRP